MDEVENKVKVISMVRMIRHELRRDGLNREDGRKKSKNAGSSWRNCCRGWIH